MSEDKAREVFREEAAAAVVANRGKVHRVEIAMDIGLGDYAVTIFRLLGERKYLGKFETLNEALVEVAALFARPNRRKERPG